MAKKEMVQRKIVKFPNYKQLTNHLHGQHENVTLCNLCLEHRPLFISEQQLIPRNELKKHQQEKHFYCKFCSQYFFDKALLYHHMQTAHHNCHLCDQKMMFRYYKDLNSLRDHHRSAHFVCSMCDNNPDMRNSDISYAFRTLDEYCGHMRDIHSIVESNYRGGKQSSAISSFTASLFSFANRGGQSDTPTFFDLDVGTANPFPMSQQQQQQSVEESKESSSLPRYPALETGALTVDPEAARPLIPPGMQVAGKVTGTGRFSAVDDSDLAMQEAAEAAHQRYLSQHWARKVGTGSPSVSNTTSFPSLADTRATGTNEDLDMVFIDKTDGEGGGDLTTKVGSSAQSVHPMSLLHQQREKQKEIKDKESVQEKETEKKVSRFLQLAEAFGVNDDPKKMMSEQLALFSTTEGQYEQKKDDYKRFLSQRLADLSIAVPHSALAVLTLYPMDLMIWGRNNKFELSKIEKKFYQLLINNDPKAQLKQVSSISFKPMPYNERQIIHNLAKYYRCNSFEYDYEPNRYVSVVKTRDSCFPWMILSDAIGFSPSNLSQSQLSGSISSYVPSLNKLYTVTGIENPIVYFVFNESVFSAWGKVTDTVATRNGTTREANNPLAFSSHAVVVGELTLSLDRILSSFDILIQEIVYSGNCFSVGLKFKDFPTARNCYYYLTMIVEALLTPSVTTSAGQNELQQQLLSRFSGDQQLVSLLSFYRLVPDFPVNQNTKEEFDQYHNIFKEFVLISAEKEGEDEEGGVESDMPRESDENDAWDDGPAPGTTPPAGPVEAEDWRAASHAAHGRNQKKHEDWEEVDEWEEYLAEKRKAGGGGQGEGVAASKNVYKPKAIPVFQDFYTNTAKGKKEKEAAAPPVQPPSEAPAEVPAPVVADQSQIDEDFALAVSLAEEEEKQQLMRSSQWKGSTTAENKPAQKPVKSKPTKGNAAAGKATTVAKNRFTNLLEDDD